MIRTRPRYLLTGKTPITLKRRGEGKWVNGRYFPAANVEITIDANVQPMPRGIDTKLRPQGDITKQAYMVFSNSEIRQKREGDDGWDADVIVWKGDELEVVEVSYYDSPVLGHYEAYCFRREIS